MLNIQEIFKEFWLGLKEISQLTSSGSWTLEVTLVDYEEIEYKAVYTSFKVEEAPLYRLKVSGYDPSSSLQDSLTEWQNGMAFTTIDNDNDIWSSNCAERFR